MGVSLCSLIMCFNVCAFSSVCLGCVACAFCDSVASAREGPFSALVMTTPCACFFTPMLFAVCCLIIQGLHFTISVIAPDASTHMQHVLHHIPEYTQLVAASPAAALPRFFKFWCDQATIEHLIRTPQYAEQLNAMDCEVHDAGHFTQPTA